MVNGHSFSPFFKFFLCNCSVLCFRACSNTSYQGLLSFPCSPAWQQLLFLPPKQQGREHRQLVWPRTTSRFSSLPQH